MSFSPSWVCRQAGLLPGIHGVAIPNALNAAQPHRGSVFLAFGCVAAEGQGLADIGASPTPCQKRKMPVTTRIQIYWTVYKRKIFSINGWHQLNEAISLATESKIGFKAPSNST